ncbi:unnamed protein product [Prunus armeniaca]
MTQAISFRFSSPRLPTQLDFVGKWLPSYITGDGVDQHVIEIRSKLHSYTQRNLDENVLHMFENTVVLGPHWFGNVPEEMAKLFKEDIGAPLCYQSSSPLASHT